MLGVTKRMSGFINFWWEVVQLELDITQHGIDVAEHESGVAQHGLNAAQYGTDVAQFGLGVAKLVLNVTLLGTDSILLKTVVTQPLNDIIFFTKIAGKQEKIMKTLGIKPIL